MVAATLTLFGAEWLFRFFRPHATFSSAVELGDFATPHARAAFERDDELGVRPRLDGRYTRFGTIANSYSLDKSPGVTRLLFIGDSVTHRGRIVAALRSRYGNERFEYWNAGVESFSTAQEVLFFKRYNIAVEPDHLILTFTLNDFQTTPVALADKDGRLVVVAPRLPVRQLNRWLFEHSVVYRAWLGLTLREERSAAAIAREVRDSLRDLQDDTTRIGARLTVLVLPLLEPPEDWRSEDRARRERILALLADLRIRHFDLLPALQLALTSGAVVMERPNDPQHPSDQAAEYFAAFLFERGLL